MWIVLIEWDGRLPPTQYYTALHNLSLRVRGDKEFDPIVRRAGETNRAVIVQEGALLVPSESLARHVMYLAKQHGARSVMIGQVEVSAEENRQLSDAELEVIRRFEQTYKKRGRPSQADTEDKDWVVTCPECVHTSVITARRIMQCPRCGGLRVSTRIGARTLCRPPTDTREWAQTRFYTGDFEIPNIDNTQLIPPMPELIQADTQVIEGIVNKKWAMDFTLADMVFCARRYFTQKDRQHARVECCLKMYEQGFNQSDISLFESRSNFEPIDAAIFYGGDYRELISLYSRLKDSL